MQARFLSHQKLIEFYEEAKTAFVTKMKTENDELSNLKFKLAAFVVRELTHCNQPDFNDYFVSTLAECDNRGTNPDDRFLTLERDFHQAVAAYLIQLGSDSDYAKQALAQLPNEAEKESFWKPIVADAFLIAGIYFAPSLGSLIRDRHLRVESANQDRSVGSASQASSII